MITNVDTVRGIIMGTKNLNFDEVASEYMTLRYRAFFYVPGHEYIFTDWYYDREGFNALKTLRNIVRKSGAVEDVDAYIQSQQVVVTKAVRIVGDIENEE